MQVFDAGRKTWRAIAALVLSAACGGRAVPSDRGVFPAGASAEIASVDVYGTSDAIATRIRERYGARLAECVAALTSGDDARHAAVRKEVLEGVRALGSFAFVDTAFVFDPPRDGKLTARVGVDVVETQDRERRMPFAALPTREVKDPGGLVAAWLRFEEATTQILMSGKVTSTTCPALHCIIDVRGTEAEALERQFVADVPAAEGELVDVLHHSRDAESRAAAAFLLAYGGDAARLVSELVPSIRDPDMAVRNNVLRVLGEVALLHREIDIPLDPIIEAIDFPNWTDRNKALLVLAALVEARPTVRPAVAARAVRALLASLRAQAPQIHDSALRILRLVSGQAFGDRDYAAWQAWADSAR